MISLIVAYANNYNIGYQNQLPWGHLKTDLKWFRQKTINQVVVMGRRTWQSLPPKYQPLPQRINIVVSRQVQPKADHTIQADLIQQIKELPQKYPQQEIFIIGGLKLYQTVIEAKICQKFYLTKIQADYPSDCQLDLSPVFSETKTIWQEKISPSQQEPALEFQIRTLIN